MRRLPRRPRETSSGWLALAWRRYCKRSGRSCVHAGPARLQLQETYMAYTVPASLRASLSLLADALLPIEEWLKTKPYVPDPSALIPSEGPLPWRSGSISLNANSLELIRAFEAWIDDDATDEALS